MPHYDYRALLNLLEDYPMVAPNHAEKRGEVVKSTMRFPLSSQGSSELVRTEIRQNPPLGAPRLHTPSSFVKSSSPRTTSVESETAAGISI